MDVQVTLNQTLYGEYVANVLFFSNLQDANSTLQSFANSMRASWLTHLSPSLTANWSLDSITYGFLSATGIDYSVEYPFSSGPLTGGNNSDAQANQVSLLVSTQGSGSRPNRGRVYLCGLVEDAMTGGLWTQAALDDAQNLVEDWVDGINADGQDCFLRIMRRPSAVFPSYVSNGVTTVVPRNIPATQRRRRRRI